MTTLAYRSTRGGGDDRRFDDILPAGPAPDGGLYVPDCMPVFDAAAREACAGLTYPQLAARILKSFAPDSSLREALPDLCEAAYANFSHPAIVPLKPLANGVHLLELFHGPTLAFKDLAMQCLGQLVPQLPSVRARGASILVATSGDTGSAAVAAFAGAPSIRLFVLYPHERVSEVQRRQMTTSNAANVRVFAVRGNFDDCQRMVKEAFADEAFAEKQALLAVNSINWVRIAAQAAYYAAATLAPEFERRPVDFTVPSGNFGNAYAASVAKKMGFAVGRIGVATNRNDVLARFLASGTLERRDVKATIAPSMDIGAASNFERLLYSLCEEDGAACARLMREFQDEGRVELGAQALARARVDFWGAAVGEDEIREEMRATYRETGVLLDPHTAVGASALRARLESGEESGDDGGRGNQVVLGCAHAAKFPEATEAATGVVADVPPQLEAALAAGESFSELAPEAEALKAEMRGA